MPPLVKYFHCDFEDLFEVVLSTLKRAKSRY